MISEGNGNAQVGEKRAGLLVTALIHAATDHPAAVPMILLTVIADIPFSATYIAGAKFEPQSHQPRNI